MAPIAMLNGLWFHTDARRERYAEYSEAVMPIIEAVGADVLLPPLAVDEALEGDFDPDLAFFIRYPSAAAFDEMWRSEEYGRVAPLRAGGLRRAVLTRCAIDPSDADPVSLSPGIAVLNMLWFQPGGRERYDEYLAAAQPRVEAVGGRYATPRFVPDLAVEDDLVPDLIFIGNYPSRSALGALVADAEYQRAATLRTAAVRRSSTTTLVVPG